MECRSNPLHPTIWCSSFLGWYILFPLAPISQIWMPFILPNTWMLCLLSSLLYPENEDGIFDAVLRGHIDFASDPWPSISNSAKDLVKKMLRQDPKERLTGAEILSKSIVKLTPLVYWHWQSWLYRLVGSCL